MRPLPARQKQPTEVRTLTFDFSTKLATGDALTGTATITVDTGITAAGTTRSGNTVTTRISSGTDAEDYRVECSCATTGGDTLELAVTIEVRADAN